jgi:hypothetical protein
MKLAAEKRRPAAQVSAESMALNCRVQAVSAFPHCARPLQRCQPANVSLPRAVPIGNDENFPLTHPSHAAHLVSGEMEAIAAASFGDISTGQKDTCSQRPFCFQADVRRIQTVAVEDACANASFRM